MPAERLQNRGVVIIGAGPAGMTAAIQLKRYGIPFVLLEKEHVGGLLWNANLVENYPGFPAGVSGPKLIGLIQKQIERIGVEVLFDTVTGLHHDDDHFLIETSRAAYRSRYVVVASGTSPNSIPIPVLEEIKDRIFSDVYHLLDARGKKIVIIGAGDAAFDYALNLVKKGNIVTILNRGRDVKCLQLLWERTAAEPAIEYRAEVPVSAVTLDETSGRLEVRLEAGESIFADYLLFAIGRIPQMDFLSDELVDKNVENLYFIGDVKNGLYRQAAIAAGDGLRAAMQIYHSLKEGPP